jgi:hypothetical protein
MALLKSGVSGWKLSNNGEKVALAGCSGNRFETEMKELRNKAFRRDGA